MTFVRKPDAYIEAAVAGEVERLSLAVVGERNETLFKCTVALARLAVPEGQVIRALKPVALAIGLKGQEFYKTVKSGMTAGWKNPRDIACAQARSAIQRSSTETQPMIMLGKNGPDTLSDEVRRHVYWRDGVAVRVKIKRESGRYSNWYAVGDGKWQALKPDGYQACPYIGVVDPFNPQFVDEVIHWTEGEKDTDTLGSAGLPAFTFGGTGDGLPPDIDHYLKGRDFVIHADNDVGGKSHAIRKAERAHSAGAMSIRIVKYPELPDKGDVTDFLAAASAIDLEERIGETAPWTPPLPAARTEVTAARELVTCNLADVVPEKIDWVWHGRLAKGKLTIIAGEPGLGKSQVATYVASTISRGAKWVQSNEYARRGRVLILSAEDGLADTVRPRFDAAGGDSSMISVIRATQSHNRLGSIRGTFNLAADLLLLEKEIKRLGDVELVSIDPLSSYLPTVDSHNNTAVRAVLEPVSEMAERLNVAIQATTHFSKGDGKAINRIIGSIAFVAAARAVFTVVEDPEDDGRRLFLSLKNNIAPRQPGLAFRLEQRKTSPGIITSAVVWDDTAVVTVSAEEVLSGVRSQPSIKGDAIELLQELLNNGPMSVGEIEQHAIEASLLVDGKPIGQAKPFRLARSDLGIKPKRVGGLGADGQWVWELPGTKVPKKRYDA
jgi:putative DNA primase/helicase